MSCGLNKSEILDCNNNNLSSTTTPWVDRMADREYQMSPEACGRGSRTQAACLTSQIRPSAGTVSTADP